MTDDDEEEEEEEEQKGGGGGRGRAAAWSDRRTWGVIGQEHVVLLGNTLRKEKHQEWVERVEQMKGKWRTV